MRRTDWATTSLLALLGAIAAGYYALAFFEAHQLLSNWVLELADPSGQDRDRALLSAVGCSVVFVALMFVAGMSAVRASRPIVLAPGQRPVPVAMTVGVLLVVIVLAAGIKAAAREVVPAHRSSTVVTDLPLIPPASPPETASPSPPETAPPAPPETAPPLAPASPDTASPRPPATPAAPAAPTAAPSAPSPPG